MSGRATRDVSDQSIIRADEVLEVARTKLGDVVRLDIANLGARVPPGVQAGSDAGPPGRAPDDEAGRRWAQAQNAAICAELAAISAQAGGDFSSLAEWTVLYARGLYDGADMRAARQARFAPGYRAAITTLAALDPARGWGVRINGVAYVGRAPGALTLRVWQPQALYPTEHMTLAPAVIAEFGGVRQIFFSGLVAWDGDLQPMLADKPRRQIRYVLELLEACLREQGGSRASVVRLRPFTQSADVGHLIRAEVAEFWRHDPPPTVCLFDRTSFGTPPQLHMELQAFAAVPNTPDGPCAVAPAVARADAASGAVQHLGPGERPVTTLSRRSLGALEMASIGEIRPAAGAAGPDRQAASAVERLRSGVAAAGMEIAEVRSLVAFVTSDAVERTLRVRLRAATDAALHVVPVAPFPDLGDDALKLEAFAIRPRRGG